LIHDILQKHGVKASFFLANEKTVQGDYSLDPAWAPYWRTLVSEGHAFGTHTFDHVSYRGVDGEGRVRMRPQFGANAGKTLSWNGPQVCAELNRVKARFKALTGADLDPIWRAPGGKTSATLNTMAQSCGYRHAGWAEAGFLPSDKWPNALLLRRALANIRPGDIVMAHLGIWSRQETFAPTLDPLIAGLKAQGYCFRTLREHPQLGGRS
jgi:peptidoglycan/xylan/chitin deacetylase (PgdA/CDA1 family)